MLVIQAVVTGFDCYTDPASKRQMHAATYDALPAVLKDEVLKAYAGTGREPQTA